MKRIVSAAAILLIFVMFSGFEVYRKSEKIVLKIISPTEFQVDLNGNKIFDDGESICMKGMESFSQDISKNQEDLQKSLDISHKDILSLGYLAQDFSEKTLYNRRVKIKFTKEKSTHCRYADIYINTENFAQKLINEGFALQAYTPVDKEKYEKRLSEARKLDLYILNHKSNKYHTLDCPYGLVASDIILLTKKHLPSDSAGCKVCTVKSQQPINTYPLIVSSGSIKLFLTDFTIKLKPDNKCESSVCREVLNLIKESKFSIDMALFGWDSIPAIQNELKNAMNRGVSVRLVYDDNYDSAKYYGDTHKLAELVGNSKSDKSDNKNETNMLMHNKFIIFDNQKVLTGSMNFSKTGLSGFNANSMILINSGQIAKIFSNEFEQMFSGVFHTRKLRTPENKLALGGSKISAYFSPQDKTITSHIVPLINNASKYVYVPAFLITHKELSDALLQAKQRGLDVKIIVDATNPDGRGSQIKRLRESGIAVKTENYAGKMHSKTILIDDRYLISGSMNFSNSGENRNDENCLIIEDSKLTRHYRGYFEYIWNKIPDKYLHRNPRAESLESIGSCTDGIDNNFDDKIDSADAGCKPR